MDRREAGRLGYAKIKDRWAAFIANKKVEARRRWPDKPCPSCGKTIPYEKRKNKFCCRACAYEGRRSKKRYCLNCGKPLRKGARNHCSMTCAATRRYKDYIERWLRGEERGGSDRKVSSYVRRWLLETRGEACELCGWAERHTVTGRVPLEVNHKDGVANNHKRGNLELLCPNCHSLTPTYRRLNKHSTRAYRRAGVA